MTDDRRLPRGSVRRRGFLALAVAALLPLQGWRALVEVRRAPLAARLGRVLRDRDSACVVGAAYLAHVPAEAAPALLVAHLRAGLGDVVPPRDAALRVVLEARVRRDFVEGATCRLDGWVLSRTEARLAALTALRLGVVPPGPRVRASAGGEQQ